MPMKKYRIFIYLLFVDKIIVGFLITSGITKIFRYQYFQYKDSNKLIFAQQTNFNFVHLLGGNTVEYQTLLFYVINYIKFSAQVKEKNDSSEIGYIQALSHCCKCLSCSYIYTNLFSVFSCQFEFVAYPVFSSN